ncbi:hypothetical protein JQU52_10255 [Paralysiella testudinis]|uniref:Uncharacterized protein n=2 Tax=Paralysiella testudinis TaxID=2809020 RepID=A0A892ZK96_9NEIS|nr:hypothetical protein JQU52_01250 [Paralysiella testudinis]QRQ83342.1 hypothetical protein JQU52_10255 [Paralysiella testudinis]
MLVAGGSWYSGYSSAKRAGEAQLAALRQEYAAQALAAEQQYSAKLAEAAEQQQKWYDFAQHQSSKLAQATQTLDAQAALLQKEIPYAIAQDAASGGHCHSGLGADSLRLYRRALGYPD